MNNQEITPRFPKHISPRNMDVGYYEFGDILSINFHGSPQPAVNVPATVDLLGLDWRVDFESHEVVGFEIHGFLESFLPHYPETEALAKLASIPDALVKQSLAYADKDAKERLEFFRLIEAMRNYAGAVST